MITELELCAHVSINAETQRINLQRNTKKETGLAIIIAFIIIFSLCEHLYPPLHAQCMLGLNRFCILI